MGLDGFHFFDKMRRHFFRAFVHAGFEAIKWPVLAHIRCQLAKLEKTRDREKWRFISFFLNRDKAGPTLNAAFRMLGENACYKIMFVLNNVIFSFRGLDK